ncbi:MAG: TetR/AcrR family transcriptional regulator [Solirubrobacterales bacterium]
MATVRREPKQQRSRDRVDQMLTAAGAIIGESGIEGLSMIGVSERSGVPVGTAYRYFTDRDELAAAFLDAEMEKIDQAVAAAFMELELVSVRSIVETSILAHFRHHKANPEMVMAWFGTPRPRVVHEHVQRMDERMGTWLREAMSSAGLLSDDAPSFGEDMLVRLGDRMFEYVFSRPATDEVQLAIVENFSDMVATHLERFATPAGVAGIPIAEFGAKLGELPTHRRN